jgi:hypothetical protein
VKNEVQTSDVRLMAYKWGFVNTGNVYEQEVTSSRCIHLLDQSKVGIKQNVGKPDVKIVSDPDSILEM